MFVPLIVSILCKNKCIVLNIKPYKSSGNRPQSVAMFLGIIIQLIQRHLQLLVVSFVNVILKCFILSCFRYKKRAKRKTV
jgi:hypothetical protein